jgi:hypothetical protein
MNYTLDDILASIDQMKKEIRNDIVYRGGDEVFLPEERKNKFVEALVDKIYEILGGDEKASLIFIRDEFTKKMHYLVARNREIMMKFVDLEQDKQDMIFEKIDEMIKSLPSQTPSDQSHQIQKGR